jgi:hypothetical protein
MSDKRVGPRVTVTKSCDGCAACQTESYAVQGDSGIDWYCAHEALPKRRSIGLFSTTPDWCPASTPASPSSASPGAALTVLRELVEAYSDDAATQERCTAAWDRARSLTLGSPAPAGEDSQDLTVAYMAGFHDGKKAAAALEKPDSEVATGFKLVPVEPTPEMVAAMAVTQATSVHQDGRHKVHCLGMAGAEEAYEAMLSAAPSAKPETVAEPLWKDPRNYSLAPFASPGTGPEWNVLAASPVPAEHAKGVRVALTDERITKLIGEMFITGENQLCDRGYLYRSFAVPSNVLGRDLVDFARAIEKEVLASDGGEA